ncbi:hypothetical protein [Streptomyces sp. NPDC048248]|uniref:hypothetical protein n=1 Tax=Streptomyces sp. NPDC048248 TaxID=3365523 RepID=UPI0037217BCD
MADRDAGSGTGTLFFAFAPWIIFDVVAGPSTWGYAALAGLIAAVVLTMPDLRRGQVNVLNVAGLLFFAVVSVLALVLDRSQGDWLEEYAQVISSGFIALVAFVSLAFDPFTAQYARQSTPEQVWDTPRFKKANRVLTLVWACVFAVIALLGWLALRFTSGDDWLNWVIPVALIVLAVRFTRNYAARKRG